MKTSFTLPLGPKRCFVRSTALLSLVVLLTISFCLAPLAFAAETKQSALCGSDGKNYSASDFAALMALYLQPNMIKDAKFFFQECFGGGMLPPLQGALGNNIQWIAGSASTADKESYGPPDPTAEPDRWTKPLAAELAKPNQKLSDTLQKASDNDIRGPKGDNKEQPQTASSNTGGDIKMSDGRSHHAIIWTGAKDANRHDNDVTAITNALNTAWAGAPDGTSITQVSTGAQLEAAMKKLKDDGKLNANEEFLFYATDHGEQIDTIVPDKARVDAGTVDQELFTLDPGVLQALAESDPLHTPPQPTLEIQYSSLTSADPVSVNGHLIGTLLPSLSDMTFNVPMSFLLPTNVIQINNALGSDFFLNLKVFSTGFVNNATVPEPHLILLASIGLVLGLCVRRR